MTRQQSCEGPGLRQLWVATFADLNSSCLLRSYLCANTSAFAISSCAGTMSAMWSLQRNLVSLGAIATKSSASSMRKRWNLKSRLSSHKPEKRSGSLQSRCSCVAEPLGQAMVFVVSQHCNARLDSEHATR